MWQVISWLFTFLGDKLEALLITVQSGYGYPGLSGHLYDFPYVVIFIRHASMEECPKIHK